MQEPVSEDVARGRWMVINAVRLSGAAMVVVGMLMIVGKIAAPQVVGYAILGVGLLDIFLMPQVLARKWRSPLE